MRIKDGFEIRNICCEKVIIEYGLDNLDFNKLINLNESAAFLWEASSAKESFTEETLVNLLCEEYDIDTDTAANDVHSLLKGWKSLGLVSE